MSQSKTSQLFGQSKWRLILVILFSAVLLLELTFSIFKIPGRGRAITPFDMELLIAVCVLIVAWPKLFTAAWRLEFRRTPILFKLAIGLALYVLTIKAAYFLGYLAGMIFK